MFKKIRKAVRVFDVFAAPIVFNFNGQESYKSFTGGISTLIVIFLIIVTFQSQIRIFSNKETIFFETTSDFQQDPQNLQLSNSKFLFAIRIEQSSNYATNPFFIINATQQYYATKNGTTSRSASEIYLEPCKLERFQEIDPQLSIPFLDNKLSEYLCPTKDSVMNLKGAFLSDEFDFIKFSVQSCTHYTNKLNWNVTCATDQERATYLQENGQYRLVLYTTNYVVNPTKPSNYYELYLAEDLNFLFQPNLKQVVNVFFRNYEVSTDQSLFLNKEFIEESFIYRNERTFKVETVLDPQQQSSPITVYFRSDFFRERAERRFQKIDQLFAYFGGIFNVFFLIFGIFVKQYNSIFYKMKMANKLYQFPDLQKKDTVSRHTNQQEILVESVKKKSVQLRDINNQQLLQEHGYKSKVEFLYTYFKEVVIRQISLYPSLQYILYIGTFRKKFVNQQNMLLDRSLEYIDADTNVRILIKKIQEIGKLKNIFFSEPQLELFNFMQRPQITLKEHVSEVEILKSKKLKGMEHFKELLKAYRFLIENPSPNPEVQLTTNRLIQSIGKEMELILQVAIAERQTGNQQIIQTETLNQ